MALNWTQNSKKIHGDILRVSEFSESCRQNLAGPCSDRMSFTTFAQISGGRHPACSWGQSRLWLSLPSSHSVPSLCIPVACVCAHDSPIKWQKHEQKCDQTASTSPFCRNADSNAGIVCPISKQRSQGYLRERCPIMMVPQTLTLWITYIYQKETGQI